MKAIDLSYGKTLGNKAQGDCNQREGALTLSPRALMEVSYKDVSVKNACGMWNLLLPR